MQKREILVLLYFGNINLKEPNLFLFLNFFFVFLSFKVRSLRQFSDFLGTFSYKSERCKCKYIKYEQRPISLIFQKRNTVRLNTEPPKNQEIGRNSKTKIYRKASFLIILPCLYLFFEKTNASILPVLSLQSVDNFLKRNHQGLVWWNSLLICIPMSKLLSVKVGAW